VQPLNESHQNVGESPVRLKRMDETNYTTAEVAKIEIAIKNL
jgi:hypothetical protein